MENRQVIDQTKKENQHLLYISSHIQNNLKIEQKTIYKNKLQYYEACNFKQKEKRCKTSLHTQA